MRQSTKGAAATSALARDALRALVRLYGHLVRLVVRLAVRSGAGPPTPSATGSCRAFDFLFFFFLFLSAIDLWQTRDDCWLCGDIALVFAQ
jgi:hypothetical protein